MIGGFDEASARQVLMVQAFETAVAGSPLWTPEDQAWATGMAADSTGSGTAPEGFLAERARWALQRLQPREPQVERWLDARGASSTWPWLALAVGGIAGLATDAIGAGQRINLLAPPVWAVVLWNLAVYAALAVAWLRRRGTTLAVPGPWRRALMGWGQRGLQRWRGAPTSAALQAYLLNWTRVGAGLLGARTAMLLHLAALALAGGLVGSLYLRGLVLDYRAGWQSTFLEAPAVHALLSALFAPACLVTGIGVPSVDALAAQRVWPGAEATAAAAPWIHLYASTLGLFVLLPRLLLAARAAWQVRRLSRRLPLPLGEPYFRRLLQRRAGSAARVQVWPYGAAPSAQVALDLRRLLEQAWGEQVELVLAPTTTHGSEEGAVTLATEPDWALRIALFDLAASAEAEAQGRFVEALQTASPAPLLALVDEGPLRRRFANLPERLSERRASWRQWADRHRVALWSGDLGAPDLDSARAVLGTLAA